MKEPNKKYLIFAVSLALLAGVCSYASFFLFSEIKEISDDFVSKKKNLEYLATRSKDLESVDDYDEIEKALENIRELFSDPQRPIEDVLFFREVANQNSLTINIEIERREKSESDPWPHNYFRISLAGSYPNFMEFLERIESKRWLMEIDSLNIRKATERDAGQREVAENEIVASLSLKTYFLEE